MESSKDENFDDIFNLVFTQVLDCRQKTFKIGFASNRVKITACMYYTVILTRRDAFCLHCRADGCDRPKQKTNSPQEQDDTKMYQQFRWKKVLYSNGEKLCAFCKSGFQFLARIHWVFEESYSLSRLCKDSCSRKKGKLLFLLSLSESSTQMYCYKLICLSQQLLLQTN